MEKKITAINVAPEATIRKALTVRGPGFALSVTLVLEDGSTVASSVSATRKKDVLPNLERDRRNAASGAMKASFSDSTGEYFGTVTRYELGAAGLVPLTA